MKAVNEPFVRSSLLRRGAESALIMAPKAPSDANALGALRNQEIGSPRHSPAFDCLLSRICLGNYLERVIGFEPTTLCLASTRSTN